MNINLLMECYKDKVKEVSKLKLEQEIIEKAILEEANSKLEMNKVLSGFKVDEFERYLSSILGMSITDANKTTRIGKGYRESEIEFSFMYDSKKFFLLLPVWYYDVEQVNLLTLGKIGIGMYKNDYHTVIVNYIDKMCEIEEVMKQYVGKSVEEIYDESSEKLIDIFYRNHMKEV